MADRPIFEVEINDGEFKKFAERLDAYKVAVDQLPTAWKASASETDDLRVHMERMSALLEQQNELMESLGKHTAATSDNAMSTGAAWAAMYYSSKHFVKNIHDSTMSLTKWLRLSAVFSGLLGAGGLFGIDRMALGTAHRRTEAAGFGLSVGEKASFDVAFGRLGNSEGLLNGFNSALHDVTNPALYTLGVAGKVRGMTASDAFAESLPYIKKLVDHTDPAQLGNVIKARQLDRLAIDVHTASVIKGMKPEEIRQMQEDYKNKKGPLGLPDPVAKQWTEFTTQMHRSWLTIETVLGKNLVHITPGLIKLSDEMVRLFKSLTKDGGLLNGLFKSVNTGMVHLADTILSGEFQASVAKFMHNFDLTKKDFAALNDWFSSHETYIKGAVAALAGLWAGSKVGAAVGALGVGAVAGAAGVVGGAVLGSTPLNGNEGERGRQRLAATPGAVSLGNGAWSVPKAGGGRQVVKENEEAGPQLNSITAPSAPSGSVVKGLRELEQDSAGIPGGRRRISAENDDYHHRVNPGSMHTKGLAFDQSLQDSSAHASAAEYMRGRLKRAGLGDGDYRVIDEYAHPSAHSTGGHIHTQFNSREAADRYRQFSQRSAFGHPSHAAHKGKARVEVIDNTGGAVQVAH